MVVRVNGTELDRVTLHGTVTKAVHLEQVAIPASVFDSTEAATNTIQVTLEATDDTACTADRVLWVSAVRIRYQDGGTWFYSTPYANPDAAAYTTSGAPGAEVLAGSNADWRIAEYLDGVSVVHALDSGDAGSFDSDAFDRLMECTCDWMHGLSETTYARRCLAEVQGADFSVTRDTSVSDEASEEAWVTSYDRGYFVWDEMRAHVSWLSRGGGASLQAASDLQVTFEPPAGCSAWDPATAWTPSSAIDDAKVTAAYHCVVDWLRGDPIPSWCTTTLAPPAP